MFIQLTRIVMGEQLKQYVNGSQIVYIAPMPKGCEVVLGNRERWQVRESADEVLAMCGHPTALETRTVSPPRRTSTKSRKNADQ